MARGSWSDDRGSTIPLMLGFFVVALLLVAGAVLAGDTFAKQRDLQSVCDGAAARAANALDPAAARTRTLTGALPLESVQQAADDYLAEDPSRASVTVQATVSPDGGTVLADCAARSHLAFGAVIGRGNGVDQHASSTARGVLG